MYKNSDNNKEATFDPTYAVKAGWWAIATVAILLIIKGIAYYNSHSVSVLGTLIDSLNDGVISVMMLAAVMVSITPPDEEHRYGHGKAEGLGALFQAAFLSGTAVFLALESMRQIVFPQDMHGHMIGITVAFISIVLSGILILVQNYAIQKTGSLAITADRYHYSGDLLLNGGVIAALLMNYYGGPVWIDGVFGVLVSVYFTQAAYKTAKNATNMLMDHELPEEMRKDIEAMVLAHEAVFGIHDLRTRRMGMNIHISFDVEVEPEQSLRKAHDIARDLETQILKQFPNAEIIIHLDPKGDIYDARHKVQGVHH